MQYKDYYKTLGVARDASPEDIKRAYRRLARKFHPDVSKEPNAEARFKEVNEANEVLRDPDKRAAYDALGTHWRAGQDFRPPPGAGGRNFEFGPDDIAGFSDFFSTLFGREAGGGGGGPRDRRQRRGQDRVMKVGIELEEAYRGATRALRFDDRADGRTGSADGGTGARTLNVRIPAGVTSGQRIRLAGQGLPGRNGGPAGDLYLEIELNPHRIFSVDGRDIRLKLPLAPWEAALGASVTVPTLGGSVTLRIPPGSQSGQRLRLKGRGLPGDPPGDAFAELEIVAPPAPDEAAREAYRRLAERIPFNPRAGLGT